MGTPDTVIFRCPACNVEIWEQYKPGSCESFDFENLPEDMWQKVNGQPLQCNGCGKRFVAECEVVITYGAKVLRPMTDAEVTEKESNEAKWNAYWNNPEQVKLRADLIRRIREGK